MPLFVRHDKRHSPSENVELQLLLDCDVILRLSFFFPKIKASEVIRELTPFFCSITTPGGIHSTDSCSLELLVVLELFEVLLTLFFSSLECFESGNSPGVCANSAPILFSVLGE